MARDSTTSARSAAGEARAAGEASEASVAGEARAAGEAGEASRDGAASAVSGEAREAGGGASGVGGASQAAERADHLRDLLRRLELAGQHQRAARARQTGVHQVELAALEHLSVTGGLTPGELGHRLGLTSGGVTALAGRLMDAGHVQRAPHPRDRRMRILTSTPAGEAHLAEFIGPVAAPAERVLAWVGEADAQLIERFLDSLVALKAHAAAATPGPEPERASEPYSPALLM